VDQHRFNIINPIQSKFKIFFILKENQIKFNKVDYIILYIYIYIYIDLLGQSDTKTWSKEKKRIIIITYFENPEEEIQDFPHFLRDTCKTQGHAGAYLPCYNGEYDS
jgi:hypothetical protein